MGQAKSTNSKLESWLKQVQEEALEPELEIYDAHHHLWDPVREPRGDLSLAAKVVQYLGPSIRLRLVKLMLPKAGLVAFGVNSPVVDRFLPDTLQSHFGGHKVTKSVVIQAQWEDKSAPKGLHQVSESKTYYAQSQADPNGFPHACVSFIDLNLGEEEVAAAIKEHQSVNPNVRGFRHQLAWHESPEIFSARDAVKEMSRSENFRGGLRAIEKAGLSFDIYCYHTQLAEVAEMIQLYPNMQFILDHIGTPVGVGEYAGEEGRAKSKAEWEQGLALVAACPNVVVKLSGFLMPVCGFGFEHQEKPPTSDEVVEKIFPYFSYVISTFGVDRCIFASNFPVDMVSLSYTVLFNSYKKICQKLQLSEEDKEKMFKLNASRIYSL